MELRKEPCAAADRSEAYQAAAQAVLTVLLKGSVEEVRLLERGGYRVRSRTRPSSEPIVTMAGPLAGELQDAEQEGRPADYASIRTQITEAIEYESREGSSETNREAPAEFPEPIWQISRFLSENGTHQDTRLRLSTLIAQAENLARGHWTEIGWVAAALLEHQRLSGAQVARIVGAADERA